MANTLNISHDQGSTLAMVLTVKDEADATIDLTGYTFRGQARTSFGSSEIAFSLSLVIRNQVTDEGIVDMTIEPEETESLTLTEQTDYVYDVEMVSSGGVVTRIMEGIITVSPEVTK